MSYLAVIDVETTGINPWQHHRIVEIAAVVMHRDGTVVREFVSLVNPDRDIGPTSVHGLCSEDVLGAPRFAEIAGVLTETLEGCVAIAGHNVQFDHSFVAVEFDRLGLEFPNTPRLCTLRLAGGGTLCDCCDAFGIAFDGSAHTALNDARATARLLATLLAEEVGVLHELSTYGAIAWPKIPHSGMPRTREATRSRLVEPPSYIQRLLARKPTDSLSEAQDSAVLAYSALLDRVLEDRHIDDDEGEALVDVASHWGLDGETIHRVHGDYLRHLAVAALADRVVTDSEHRDLERVARLLGIESTRLDTMLAGAVERLTGLTAPVGAPSVAPHDGSLSGMCVCFTGEFQSQRNGEPITRDLAEQLAIAAGLKVVGSVTKKLDLLVVADPQTQSGKAKKARQYGIRVLHEPVFWNAIGVEVQ